MLHLSAPGAVPSPIDRVEPDLDPRTVYRAIWRGKWLLAGAVLLALLAAGLYLGALTTPVYTAEASVILDGEQSALIDVGEASGSRSSSATSNATEIEVIRSRTLTRALAESATLVEDPEFNPRLREDGLSLKRWLRRLVGRDKETPPTEEQVRAEVTDAVRDALRVWSVPDTSVLKMSVESTSPEKAARLTNRLADLYITNQLQSTMRATAQASEWLSDQVLELRETLEAAESGLSRFSTSSEMMDPETLANMKRELKRLRESRAQAVASLSGAEGRLAALQAPNEDEGALATLAETTSPALGAKGARAERMVSVLGASIAGLEAAIARQSVELLKLQQLEREVESGRMIYEHALARQKELSFGRGIWRADARVLSYAEVPTSPSKPNAKLVVALAIALGGLAGSGAVLARETRRKVFRHAGEIERETGLPVLGSVPLMSGRRRNPSTTLACETSAYSEAIRNLRTSLAAAHAGRLPRVVSLTSCTPEVGKSSLTLALAHSFSMVGHRVLVIDADLRRRTLSTQLGFDGRKGGLAAAIAEEKPVSEVIFRRTGEDIEYLPAEDSDYNPADLLSMEGFSELIAKLKCQYDCILIDTAPALIVPDARMIMPASDATYLVMQWGRTTKGQVDEVLRDMRQGIRGTILNQVDAKRMKDFGYGDRREAQDGWGYYDIRR